MSKSQYSWVPKKVNYELGEGKKILKQRSLKPTEYHPLKPIVVTDSSAVRARRRQSDSGSTKSSSSGAEIDEFIDPLSALNRPDPLSAAAAATDGKSNDASILQDSNTTKESEDGFKEWSSRKLSILSRYTLDERLAALMILTVKPGEKSLRHPKYGSSVSEKLKTRLSQLDDMEEGSVKEMKTEKQREFISQINEFNQSLDQAWQANQKVNALKIAIQCAKMLADSSVMQYYPSKFVLIADLLDKFGELVYRRILSMCGGISRDNIDPKDVPENAQEICINWMLKIASIRELLPRIYIEACILPCFNLIKKGEGNSVLVRLTSMTRGVGNPLVAVYVRTYLCMTGRKHAAKFKGHLNSNFYDFVATYKQLHTTSIQNEIALQGLDMPAYLSLYVPALEWILSCISNRAHETAVKDVLEKCEKTGNNLLILQCILSSFKPDCISARATEFCSTIMRSQDTLYPKTSVFCTLGASVCAADPPENEKLSLLNDVWKYIIKIQDPEEYISCAVIWTEYAVKNFQKREVNTILGDVLKHMVPDRAFEKHYMKLQDMLQNVLTHMTDFSVVFSMDKFLPFLDMFQNDAKVDACKCVATFFARGSDEDTSDPLVINGLLYVCRAMHASINSLSLESDRKSVSDAICGVIQKVTFGKDFEQQLSFYVECRAAFHNLDLVLSMLVCRVNTLSTKATKIVRHSHTTKTAAFVRACAAYCFITVPSLSDVMLRLSLYLVSGQAALINHCITQGDAMFCAAISQLLDLPQPGSSPDGKSVISQNILVSYILNFLSTLLTVPDHPEQGVLYLLRGLVNVISGKVGTNPLTRDSCATIYTHALSLLAAYSQDKYLYRVDNVDCNEDLYSSDQKFLDEVSAVGTVLLDELLGYLAGNESQGDQGKRSEVALKLFSAVIAHGDLEDLSMQKLASNTWGILLNSKGADRKLMAKILDHLKSQGGTYTKFADGLTTGLK